MPPCPASGATATSAAGRPVPVEYADEPAFRRWCAAAAAVLRPDQVNLRGLHPLLRAEIQWGMCWHARRQHGKWELAPIQRLADYGRARGLRSLTDLDPGDPGLRKAAGREGARIASSIAGGLHPLYVTPGETREAGYILTEHFGRKLSNRTSRIDLDRISQRWLRDLVWDHFADVLRSPSCPRSGSTFDHTRRAGLELSAFLELAAPGGGHDPRVLTAGHMHKFAADQRQRELDGLTSLGARGVHGKPSIVTANTRQAVFHRTRRLLRGALESGEAGRLGLDRGFITAMPAAGRVIQRTRPRSPTRSPGRWPTRPTCRPWHGTTTRSTAACGTPGRPSSSPAAAAARSSSSAWTAWAATAACPCSGTTRPRSATTTRRSASPSGPARCWRPASARPWTCSRSGTTGRPPPGNALRWRCSPRSSATATAGTPCPTTWFHKGFKNWIDSLDIGRQVPHQARHSLATSLLRAGASLTHIRRYLGHVSEKMAERYVHLAQSDLEDVLQQVWVAGPGTASPGELLAGEAAPLSREQAQALAIDLSRRSTPAEGGFCTFQPVVEGGSCPWNLDCHNCDKFVLSGADLLYWRRKREQWRLLAEGAPDDATADYLHAYFEPTARAIDGLEKALAGLGLLDDALALDMRKPQDYFHRVWSTAFRASDLAAAGDDEQDGEERGGKRVSTEAALAARRRSTEAALGRVRDAITRLRREKTQVSVAAVSRRADVSRTFLYGNPDARAAVADAIAQAGEQRTRILDAQDDEREATWRERALNAEDALKAAHAEILAQRARIGELLGQVRDLQSEWTEEAIAADHHREHHAQAARPHPHRRQPHPRGETQGRTGEPPVPRQAHRRPRSPARPAGIRLRDLVREDWDLDPISGFCANFMMDSVACRQSVLGR